MTFKNLFLKYMFLKVKFFYISLYRYTLIVENI